MNYQDQLLPYHGSFEVCTVVYSYVYAANQRFFECYAHFLGKYLKFYSTKFRVLNHIPERKIQPDD